MNSHSKTSRRSSRGRVVALVATFVMALVAVCLPTSSAQAAPEQLSRLGVQQNTMTCSNGNDGTIIAFGVIGSSTVAPLDQYPVKVDGVDAVWGYKDPDGGNYQLVGLSEGSHDLTVPGYYSGPAVQLSVKPCAPPDVELAITPSSTSGSTGNGAVKVTAYGHYVFEETFTVKLDGVILRDDFFLTATYTGGPISVNDFTLTKLGAKAYTLRLEGNKGNVVERTFDVPLSGSSPSPTPTPTPTSSTPPIFTPTASFTPVEECTYSDVNGWMMDVHATYDNSGGAEPIDFQLGANGADPITVHVEAWQKLPQTYSYWASDDSITLAIMGPMPTVQRTFDVGACHSPAPTIEVFSVYNWNRAATSSTKAKRILRITNPDESGAQTAVTWSVKQGTKVVTEATVGVGPGGFEDRLISLKPGTYTVVADGLDRSSSQKLVISQHPTPKLLSKKFSGGKPQIAVQSSAPGKWCTKYNPPGTKGWTHYSCVPVAETASAVNRTLTINHKFHNYRHNKKIQIRVRFYYADPAASSRYWSFNMWR